MAELNSVCKESHAGREAPEIVMGRCCWLDDTLVTHPHRVMRVNQTTIEQEKLSLYYKTMPARYAKRGLFWWRAQLVSFLFKLKPHMRAGMPKEPYITHKRAIQYPQKRPTDACAARRAESTLPHQRAHPARQHCGS